MLSTKEGGPEIVVHGLQECLLVIGKRHGAPTTILRCEALRQFIHGWSICYRCLWFGNRLRRAVKLRSLFCRGIVLDTLFAGWGLACNHLSDQSFVDFRFLSLGHILQGLKQGEHLMGQISNPGVSSKCLFRGQQGRTSYARAVGQQFFVEF